MKPIFPQYMENKAVYTATLVAGGWAGAVMSWVGAVIIWAGAVMIWAGACSTFQP